MAAEDGEMLAHYGAALDEIYRLRRALAYEAAVLKVHLDYKTFPKTRREVAEGQIRRMQDSARGKSQRAYGGTNTASLAVALSEAGAPQSLTRHAWEHRSDAPEGN